jgi:hypothetical protein
VDKFANLDQIENLKVVNRQKKSTPYFEIELKKTQNTRTLFKYYFNFMQTEEQQRKNL